MYSFFDTFNLRAQIIADTAPEDDYLVHFDPRDRRLARALLDSHKLVGWALIAFGALIAYQSLIMNILGDLVYRWGHSSPAFRALYLVMASLPDVVVCVALIVCGVWLVKGPKGKKQKKDSAPEEEFPAYVAEDAAPEQKEGFAMPKLSRLLGKPVTPEENADDTEDNDGRGE